MNFMHAIMSRIIDMSPSKLQRAARKGGSQPDSMDVKACLNALFTDLLLYGDVHVYQDLQLDIIVECTAYETTSDVSRETFIAWRRFVPGGYSLDVLMMQCIHEVYQQADNAHKRRVLGTESR